MASPDQKTSAELEREVEAQRSRVESTIGEIQDKLSPGQMVDELLTYARNSGGGDFIANLGKNVSTNPIPVALLGVSLVWLMASQGKPAAAAPAASVWDDDDGRYSTDFGGKNTYATISGGLRHLGHVTSDAGERYSEFSDDAGKTFRALTDAAGNRAGHFVDDAGQTFQGFRDAAGQKVDDIRDQSGALLDAATGWASDTWNKANDTLRNVGGNLGANRDRLQNSAAQAGSAAQRQVDQVTRPLLNVLHEQPLVGGALAFALGAAIGSALPHTEQEDKAFGEAADKLKQQAGEVAGDAYEKGRGQVADIYEQATGKAAELYEQVKSGTAASSDGAGA